MIFKTASIHDEELRVVSAIDEMYKNLKFMLSSPARWQGALRRSTFARALRGSNSIEGYRVTVEDAMAVAEGEEPLDASHETWQAVLGYRNAMTYVLQLCKDPDFRMSEDTLRGLHFMMIHYDLSKNPGNWRSGPVYVRDEERKITVYEPPPAYQVRGLIAELISYLNGSEDSKHALIKGSMAHLNLAMIHPFADGNGRMARCLHTFSIATKGTSDPTFSSIEEYLGRNTQDYYNVLAEVGQGSWHPQNDTRPWIRFSLTAHYRQAATILRRNRMFETLWGELETEIKAASLPDRSILALSDAAMGLRVRSSHYKHLAEVSNVVASRDLKALVRAELLVAMGEKRGRTYKASPRILEMAARIRQKEPGLIPDPFQSKDLITG
jgi:Fic family protein